MELTVQVGEVNVPALSHKTREGRGTLTTGPWKLNRSGRHEGGSGWEWN